MTTTKKTSRKDYTGEKHGHLTAEEPTDRRSPSRSVIWKFRCDCGNEAYSVMTAVRAGLVKQCKECRSKAISDAHTKHGYASGDKPRPEYTVWAQMKARCYKEDHPSYANYGGRGIRVCDRWLESFENFLADMGPRPEGKQRYVLDRYPDNDGNYEPGNCRWATTKESAYNKRSTVLIEIDGATKPLGVWAEEAGLPFDTLWKRWNTGRRGKDLLSKEKLPYRARGVKVECYGKKQNIREWAEELGIPYPTLAARYKRGLRGEELLRVERYPSGRKNKSGERDESTGESQQQAED